METLRAALGRYRHTAALLDGAVQSPLLRLEFAAVSPISRAFAPMVRDGRYDVSELAIATALQARAYGRPVVMLPVAVAARFQEAALLCRVGGRIKTYTDLTTGTIGARAYSQTTAMWLRGILQDRFGIDPARQEWITFEDAHVAEYRDPPWSRRAPGGADLLTMLRDGRIDAAIVGNDVPDDPEFRTVFPDPAAEGQAFLASHGFMPVNHLVCVGRGLAESRPDLVTELLRMFVQSREGLPNAGLPPVGRAALRPSVTLAIRYAAAQGLIPREVDADEFDADEFWDGSPEGGIA